MFSGVGWEGNQPKDVFDTIFVAKNSHSCVPWLSWLLNGAVKPKTAISVYPNHKTEQTLTTGALSVVVWVTRALSARSWRPCLQRLHSILVQIECVASRIWTASNNCFVWEFRETLCGVLRYQDGVFSPPFALFVDFSVDLTRYFTRLAFVVV